MVAPRRGPVCNEAHRALAWLQGPPVDVEARRPFIDRLLAANRSRPPAPGSAAAMGPPKAVTAHTALLHLLHSNRDLLGSAVDQCYAAEAAVARGYFKARVCVRD